MHIIPLPIPPKKNRLKLYSAIGCVTALFVIVCFVAATLIVFLINRSDNQVSLGTLEIDLSGGTFEFDDLHLEIPAGAVEQPLHLEVLREKRAPAEDSEGLTYRSIGYILRGPLNLLNGTIRVSLNVSPDHIHDNAILVIEEDVVTPSYGPQRAVHPMPTEANPSTGSLSTALAFEQSNRIGTLPESDLSAASLHNTIPALHVQEAAQQGNSQIDTITIRAESGWIFDYLVSDHFRVAYRSKFPDRQMVERGVLMLEYQYQKLSELGFSFGEVQPIHVIIKPLKGKYGQFVPSKFGASNCSLELSSTFFNADFYEENLRELMATSGHELMHFAQFVADPRWAYTKAINPLPTLWLDEATATWFEPYAVEDSSYLPPNAAQNRNFIRTPLYFAEKSQAQDHGYGVSFFIRYLTNKFGPGLVRDFYRNLSQTYGKTAAEAFFYTLMMQYDASPSIEWVNFLETYFTTPQSLGTFDGPDIQYQAFVVAGNLAENGNAQVDFNTNKALAKISTTQSGQLTGGKSASLQASFQLGGLSAEGLRISFLKKDENTIKAFQQPAQLMIAVHAPENAGVLVYGISPGGRTVALAGAPFGYLSYHDPFSETGYRLFVENFSLNRAEGSYNTLILVPFNNNTSYTKESAQTITIQLTLLGQLLPIQEIATPAIQQPTPEPALPPTAAPALPPTAEPPSSGPCAGMTVEQMRQPSILNKRCWITCFGIGQANPTDAEIRECIDRNR